MPFGLPKPRLLGERRAAFGRSTSPRRPSAAAPTPPALLSGGTPPALEEGKRGPAGGGRQARPLAPPSALGFPAHPQGRQPAGQTGIQRACSRCAVSEGVLLRRHRLQRSWKTRRRPASPGSERRPSKEAADGRGGGGLCRRWVVSYSPLQ